MNGNMTDKKLKDLKIGDNVWLYDFTDTTPIYVEKKKREGSLMTVILKWDDIVYECYGQAFGFTCVGYNRDFKEEMVFTSSFDMAWNREKRISRIKYLGKTLKKVIEDIDKV